MANTYYRCECHGGDVPHPGLALHTTCKGHRIPSRRCTRRATVQLRRTVTVDGKPIALADAMWFRYCEACAIAIENYQGSTVERRRG